jgi:molybdate transport system ATP-binding protein
MKLLVEIRKKYREFDLNVGFEASGDIMGILGASGAGKSMTLRCIAGIETPDSGRILLNDRILFDSAKGVNLPSRQRKTGFLFQNYALFPHMTVGQNIAFSFAGYSAGEREERVRTQIAFMQLEGLEKRYPGQLSGGQQQRVALARALAAEPEVLLLDEPFSALDEFLRNQMVKQLIETLADYRGVTLFVTHNMEEAYKVCRNLIIMDHGRIEAIGGREEIFHRPPTLSAARITGCRNLSGACSVSNGLIEAVDWGCRLHTGMSTGKVANVGIRSDDIRLAPAMAEENVLECWPASVIEGPFRTTVYLSPNKPPKSEADCRIQWDLPGEDWLEMKEMALPWKIQLVREKLILLEG